VIHLDVLSIREVLVGVVVEVVVEGVRSLYTLPPGLAAYLVRRYANHPSITVQPLNKEQP
jgi:hypothetical protein